MDWVCYAEKSTAFSVLRVAIKPSSVSAFQHDIMIPAHHCAYVLLSLKAVERLQGTSWYCTAFDSVRGTLSRVIKQRCDINGYRLRAHWLWKLLLQLYESGDYTPRYCGPARLGRCIRSSREGPHATQRSVYFLSESLLELFCFV